LTHDAWAGLLHCVRRGLPFSPLPLMARGAGGGNTGGRLLSKTPSEGNAHFPSGPLLGPSAVPWISAGPHSKASASRRPCGPTRQSRAQPLRVCLRLLHVRQLCGFRPKALCCGSARLARSEGYHDGARSRRRQRRPLSMARSTQKRTPRKWRKKHVKQRVSNLSTGEWRRLKKVPHRVFLRCRLLSVSCNILHFRLPPF